MKRSVDTRKILVLCLFSILLASFIAGIVISQDTPEVNIQNLNVNVNPSGISNPLKQGPTPGTWYADIALNLFGPTWEEIISAIIVFLIIAVGMYDILIGFSLFTSKYIQFIIAFGIAIIAAMSKAVIAISTFLFDLGAILGAGAVIIGVGVPLISFIVVNILLFRLVTGLKAKRTATQIRAGAEEVSAAAEGLGKIGQGIRKARVAEE